MMNISTTKFNVYHWWKGDAVSNPQWVHTDTFCNQSETQEAIKLMKSQGLEKFRIIKSKNTEIDTEQFLKQE